MENGHSVLKKMKEYTIQTTMETDYFGKMTGQENVNSCLELASFPLAKLIQECTKNAIGILKTNIVTHHQASSFEKEIRKMSKHRYNSPSIETTFTGKSGNVIVITRYNRNDYSALITDEEHLQYDSYGYSVRGTLTQILNEIKDEL